MLGLMKERGTWIRPLDLNKLIEQVLTELEGVAIVVLEGQVDQLNLPRSQQCLVPPTFKSEAPDSAGRIALRLGPGIAATIMNALHQSQDWVKNIEAMQIFVNGQRAFLAGDSFDSECISVWPGAPVNLVSRLVEDGLAELL